MGQALATTAPNLANLAANSTNTFHSLRGATSPACRYNARANALQVDEAANDRLAQ